MNPTIVIPSNYVNQRLSYYVQNKSFWDPEVMSASQKLIRFAPQKAQCYWRFTEGVDEIEELIEYPKIVAEYKPPIKECRTLVINSCYNCQQISSFAILFVFILVFLK